MNTIEVESYKSLVQQLIKFQENQVVIIQALADLIPTQPIVENVLASKPDPVLAGLQNIQFDSVQDAKISSQESKMFGEEMSEAELARQFGETPPVQQKSKPINEMTKDELDSLEAKANNSTDLYKIKARVANLARGANASLTPQGDVLVNTYVHVLKSLYDFAEGVDDFRVRESLILLIRKHEDMPGNVIAAAMSGMRQKK